MKKVDTWVVLRLDGDALSHKDYIAVKGVYDSEDFALSAISGQVDGISHYTIIRSRRYTDTDLPETFSKTTHNRIQGFDIHPDAKNFNITESILAVRSLWHQLPSQIRRRTILPLLSYLTERAVATALDAKVTDDSNSPWDLELPDKVRVEVKTILLDPDHKRAPTLQFKSDVQFQFLAIVVFLPDFTIEAARMIPAEALSMYARPGPKMSHKELINVRVTPHLLNFPGSFNISL